MAGERGAKGNGQGDNAEKQTKKEDKKEDKKEEKEKAPKKADQLCCVCKGGYRTLWNSKKNSQTMFITGKEQNNFARKYAQPA